MDQAKSPWVGDPITIAPVFPARDDASREAFVKLHAEAFSPLPYRRTSAQISGFRDALRQHVMRPGFTAFCADAGDRTVAFAYGYTTSPNYQWDRNIREALGPRARSWLVDCFALAELAVHPDAQGYGIGRAVHDALLAAQPHPRAVLSTLDAPTPGRLMYSLAGWQVLADNVRFPVSADRYVIMGKLVEGH